MAKDKLKDQSQQGEEVVPATFRLQKELLKKMKYIAFTDEITQTDIVHQSVMEYIAKWEKKNGPIPMK